MPNTIVLQTFKGKNTSTGEEVEWDRDEILCNGARIGFVGHAAGSPLQFLRILTPPTIKEIRDAVVAQRQAQGKALIGDGASMPPTPEKMKAALKALDKEKSGE